MNKVENLKQVGFLNANRGVTYGFVESKQGKEFEGVIVAFLKLKNDNPENAIIEKMSEYLQLDLSKGKDGEYLSKKGALEKHWDKEHKVEWLKKIINIFEKSGK